jgi:hypothetical protein
MYTLSHGRGWIANPRLAPRRRQEIHFDATHERYQAAGDPFRRKPLQHSQGNDWAASASVWWIARTAPIWRSSASHGDGEVTTTLCESLSLLPSACDVRVFRQ